MALRYLDDAPAVSSGSTLRYLDEPEQPVAAPPKQKTQEDFLAEAAQEMPWGERQVASMGLQLMKAGQGVKSFFGGDANQDVVRAAKVAEREAPVGAFVGDVVKYAPAALAGPAILPAAGISAGLGALYDTTGDRLGAGAMEGAGAVLGGAAVKGVSKLLGAGSLDRARDVLRQLMGSTDQDQARAVLAGASSANLRPSQALAGTDAGENIASLERLMRTGEGIDATRNPLESAAFWRNRQVGDEAARLAQLQSAAGGASAESAALSRDFMSKQLEAELGPKRVAILQELASSGRQLDELLPQLGQKEASYLQALRDAGQMRTAAGQAISPTTPRAGLVPADNVGLDVGQRLPAMQRGVGEMPKGMDEGLYQRLSNVASQIDEVGSLRRAEADALRQQISDLPPAYTSGSLVNFVDNQIANAIPGSERATVLNRLRSTLDWAGNDPARIAEIRKLNVNTLMGDLLDKGKLTSTDAAAALSQFKGQLDKTLGSKFVNEYLEPYSKGLAERSSLELMDNLRRMYETEPAKFMKAVKGDMPELLEGTQFKTIQEALGDRRFTTARQVAATKARDVGIGEASKETDAAVAQVLERKGISKMLPNMLNRYVVLANAAIKGGEMKVNQAMYRQLEQAVRDPKVMLDLLNRLPPEQRNLMNKFVIETYRKGGVTVAGAAAMDQQ